MLSTNTALVNRIYEAHENRDEQTFLSLLSRDIHVTQSVDLPWGGTFQGLDGARYFFRIIDRHIDNSIAIERILDGGERVAVIGRALGTTRKSGRPFDVPVVHIWEIRKALAVRLEVVIDMPTMLTALRAEAVGAKHTVVPAK